MYAVRPYDTDQPSLFRIQSPLHGSPLCQVLVVRFATLVEDPASSSILLSSLPALMRPRSPFTISSRSARTALSCLLLFSSSLFICCSRPVSRSSTSWILLSMNRNTPAVLSEASSLSFFAVESGLVVMSFLSFITLSQKGVKSPFDFCFQIRTTNAHGRRKKTDASRRHVTEPLGGQYFPGCCPNDFSSTN